MEKNHFYTLISKKTQVNIEYFPRKARWSPDGSSFITTSFNNELNIYVHGDNNTKLSLSMVANDMVTDIAWYPLMDINNSVSCAFAMVCPFYPIKLIDSNDSHVRSIYQCQYGGDRLASITSLAFSGGSILAGSTKTLFQCDIIRSDKKGFPKLECTGSVLSISTHLSSPCIALGLSTGKSVLIDSRSYEPLYEFNAHNHGVDSLAFADNLLFSSAKLENNVYGFDLRAPEKQHTIITTNRNTSRHISLSSKENYLSVGNEKDKAILYMLNSSTIEMVGNPHSTIIELNPKHNDILCSSGQFMIKEQQFDEDFEVEYVPILDEFCTYQINS